MIFLWSGVRKSDFRNLLAVLNYHSNRFTFRSEKTGELSIIPAFDTIKKVAEKYNYQYPELVPENNVLREIKVICKRCTTMNNDVEKKYTRGGKKKRDILKLYQRVVIHTARRSQATQLIENGTPKKKPLEYQGVNCYLSGPDGTRTRDLRRDRAAF